MTRCRRLFRGWGGGAKTAIAIEYAYRHRGDYDLVWWIPADQLPSVRASLASLAPRLGLDTASPTGVDGAIAAVLEALGRGEPYSRWLLIFDNADQPEEINDLIPRGPGDVLITSRNHRWQSVINTVPMDVFTRAESKEFLGKRVAKGLSEPEADRLAEQLGDLPLALEQAGALLAETGMPVDEYLHLLDEHATSIMAEGKSPDYPMSMTAAWKLSVATLEQQLPEARELLRCCAFFGPEPIPTDLFRQGGRATGTALGAMIADPILLSRAVRELGRFALVTLDGRSILVHRLIQALLRDELDAGQQAEYRRAVHLILAAAAPKNPDDAKAWPRYRDMLPHVTAQSTELDRSTERAVRELALNTMRYLYQSGDYSSCLDLTERFIEQWTRDSKADSPDVLQAQRHLGNTLRLLGRYPDSFRLTEVTLAKAEKGSDLSLVLRNSFGADLRARGDFRSAREFDDETRNLLERTYGAEYGTEHPLTLRVLAALALDHGLNSDYRHASNLYQQIFPLMMSQEASETTPVDILSVWNGMAWALRLLGEHVAALDVNQDALDYARETLGPEHIATLRTVNAYTIVCRRFPELRLEGIEVARNSLNLSRRLFGEAHPEALTIAINVSNLLRATSEEHHPEALELAESTASKYPRVYGEDHPYNYGCIANLALLKRVMGDHAEAQRLNTLALAGLDSRLGRNHHYTLAVATNLASDYAGLDEPVKARELGEVTLAALTRLLGPDHMVTLGCAANLALDLDATGDAVAAQALRTDAMERYRNTLGEQHPDVVAAQRGRRVDPDFDPPAI
jgi:hypothetical protein